MLVELLIGCVAWGGAAHLAQVWTGPPVYSPDGQPFIYPTFHEPERWAPLFAALRCFAVYFWGYAAADLLGVVRPASRRALRPWLIAFNLLFVPAFFYQLEVAARSDLDALARHSDTRQAWNVPDPLRLWRYPSNIKVDEPRRIRTNSLGLRAEHEFEVPPPAGRLRILCLGDSWTFGYNVAQDESWPAVLEVELRRRLPDRDIEVINAGTPGYCSYQGYLTLLSPGLSLAPQVVVLANFRNESISAQYRHLARSGVLETRDRLVPYLFRSALYVWLRRQLLLRALDNVRDGGPPSSEDGDDEAFTRSGYQLAIDAAREAGARVLCLRVVEGGVTADITAVAKASGVPYVEVPIEDSLRLSFDPTHCNAEGHRRIARSVAEALHAAHLLDTEGPSPERNRPAP